jgi:hypothetical protein
MLGAMDTRTGRGWWAPALAGSLLWLAGEAAAQLRLDGEVALDYYVAEVDDEGFEYVDAEFYAQRIANDGASGSGPLSLGAWFTAEASPAGPGTEVAYLPVGRLPGRSSIGPVWQAVAADDVPPGEYHAHVLLQDDGVPGTYDDARTLSPRVLWRGGLEAVGPLRVVPYAGGTQVSVDFGELRNNRTDRRFTNDILLTLYATYGYGPASDGYALCTRRVPGLYAGDWRPAPGFDCAIAAVPDGEYTLHLEVAEAGGRGGYSTLSGPDAHFRGGALGDGHCCGTVYLAGGAGRGLLLPLALLGLLRARGLRARARRAAGG